MGIYLPRTHHFFLDGECNKTIDGDGAGFFYPFPGIDGQTRDRRFRDQLRCVDSFMEEFASRVDSNSIVVFVGDHGTGRRAQMGVDPSEWTEAAIIERLNPLLAVRAGGDCLVGDGLVLPNLMRADPELLRNRRPRGCSRSHLSFRESRVESITSSRASERGFSVVRSLQPLNNRTR